MTRAEFLKACPKASPDCLAKNAKEFGWEPEAPARTKRRTLAQIVTHASYPTICLPAYFEAFVPVPIRSEANISTEHWRAKAARVKKQRKEVREHLAVIAGKEKPATITFCRCGRHRLDDDNLASGFKHVRDEVAALLGFDDRDPAVKWQYGQMTDSRRELGFTIIVDWGHSSSPSIGFPV